MVPAEPALSRSARIMRMGLGLDEDVRYAVMWTGAWLFRRGNSFYRSLGLTGLQYNVLRILVAADEELSQREIANRVLASSANITNLVDQLEARGLIERHPGEDRRVKLIGLTPKALDLLENSYPASIGISAGLLKNLTEKEKSTLLGLLERLVDEE